MRVYEILFIIAPTVEESDVETLIAQMSEIITNLGAKIVKTDRMGRRKLAYPIRNFKEGYYVIITMEGTGSEIMEIDRRMRVSETIIRNISIRIDEDLKRAEKFRYHRNQRQAPVRPRQTTSRAFRPVEPEIEVEEKAAMAEEEGEQ